MEAFRAGNFPRWFDRQAYQSYNFCRLYERFGKGFRRIDPESRCGFEGAGTFEADDDIDGFVRSNTFWTPYAGPADEVLRSIAPRDFPRANWLGYTKDADSLLEQYWRMVTAGCDGVWWWRWEVVGRFHGWLLPNLDPYPAVKEILRDTQIVRDGLGDLLLRSEMQTEGAKVAVVQGIMTRLADPSPTALWATCEELGRAGVPYEVVIEEDLTPEQLGQYQAVILPAVGLLNRDRCEMLRQQPAAGQDAWGGSG